MEQAKPKFSLILLSFAVVGIAASFLPYPGLPTLPTVIHELVKQNAQ
jgi:hypothetical protein